MTWVRTVLFDGTVRDQALAISLVIVLFMLWRAGIYLYRPGHYDMLRKLKMYCIAMTGIPIYFGVFYLLNGYYRDKDIRRIFGDDEPESNI